MLINVLYSLFYKWVIREECLIGHQPCRFFVISIFYLNLRRKTRQLCSLELIIIVLLINCSLFLRNFIYFFSIFRRLKQDNVINLIAAIITDFDK